LVSEEEGSGSTEQEHHDNDKPRSNPGETPPLANINSRMTGTRESESRDEMKIALSGERVNLNVSPGAITTFTSLCHEVGQIRLEHVAIRKDLQAKEGQLQRTRRDLAAIAKERDFLQNKVKLYLQF
jgi:hypothetical protein